MVRILIIEDEPDLAGLHRVQPARRGLRDRDGRNRGGGAGQGAHAAARTWCCWT